MNALANVFDLSPFMPHGACYLWRQDILLLQVGSDLLIALAYFSIPAALIVFLKHRPDIPFSWIFRLFIAFILACGITHLFSIVVVWYPAYGIEGLLKLVTAVVSAVTAIALWPLIPRGVAFPSPRMLQARNEEVATLNTQLQERVESLGTLAGGVAHNFNNLLTVIRGNAELLETPIELESNTASLAAIINASDRATELCRQMLAYSGQEHFMLKPVSLNKVVRSSGMPDTASAVNVTYSLNETIEDISAAEDQIEHLLVELIQNALEAIEEADAGDNKGEINISTYFKSLDVDDINTAAFEHSAKPGEFVMLEISDNGIGIHQGSIKQIFDPFYSTKFVGRGLGLSSVQGIVQGHGGCVFMDSERGRGTTIRVAFPVAKPGLYAQNYEEGSSISSS